MSEGFWKHSARAGIRATLRALTLIGLCQFAAIFAWGADSQIEQRIARIQDGLLPPVLVKGEPAKVTPLARRMEELRVPGVSIAVIHDGKLEWARGFGVMSIGGAPVTPDTLFQAASISKPVSAVAMMHLAQEGKVNLDADINEYLKTWKLPANDFTQHTTVTLRGLLTHSAGVTVHGFPGYEAGAPLPGVVQILNGEAPTNTAAIRVDIPPGQMWRYSGGGYVIAQQAVTDVTGISFPKLMQDVVLRPFGMKHSTFEQPLPTRALARAATPYQGDGTAVKGGPHVYPELAPAGLWTTPSDLARFAIGIQQSLSGKSRRVLSATQTRAMLEPGMNKQAIGFMVGGRTDRKLFNHGGANAGYRCLLIAYENGDGVVVMTNSDSGNPLINEITRTIAQEYGWPDYAPSERVLNAVDAKTFDRYVGAYQFQNGPTLTFWREGQQIRSRIWGQAVVDLFPTSEDEYFARTVDARVTFSGSAGSAETNAVLHQNDTERTVKRLDDAASKAALDLSLATEKRFRDQAAAPGSETALRGLITGLAGNNPAYGSMSPGLAQATRQQLAGLHAAVLQFGAVQTVSFKRVAPNGWDFYDVKFENAAREFGLLLEADGRIYGAVFSP